MKGRHKNDGRFEKDQRVKTCVSKTLETYMYAYRARLRVSCIRQSSSLLDTKAEAAFQEPSSECVLSLSRC